MKKIFLQPAKSLAVLQKRLESYGLPRRTLARNSEGIVVSNGAIHDEVIKLLHVKRG